MYNAVKTTCKPHISCVPQIFANLMSRTKSQNKIPTKIQKC